MKAYLEKVIFSLQNDLEIVIKLGIYSFMAALSLFFIFLKSSFEFILENNYQLMKVFIKHVDALIFSLIEFEP
jgi:hypothetical protein